MREIPDRRTIAPARTSLWRAGRSMMPSSPRTTGRIGRGRTGARRGFVALTLLIVAGGLLVGVGESFRYPRIARGAYWRHPALLLRATVTRLFPGKGVSQNEIMSRARLLGIAGELDARLLVLTGDPVGERHGTRSIRDRVFSLASKTQVSTTEEIFWVVAPRGRLTSPDRDWIAFEYRTGRRVCGP